MFKEKFRENEHTPPQLFKSKCIYIVTATTFKKSPYVDSDEKFDKLLEILFDRSSILNWELEAWAILPNHYHFIARSPDNASSLSDLIQAVHSVSAKYINNVDESPGRRVWYNYWDSCITNENSYLARLHYVHINPVKHGIVANADDYPYCSYHWFTRSAKIEFQERVFSQPIDRIKVFDVD